MKFFVTRFSEAMLTFSIFFVAISIVAVTASTIHAAAFLDKKLPIYSVETDKKVVALTLDCAWENSDTNELLSIFSKYNIKATFFATGDFCERYPQDIKLLHENGHSIQNHSNNHPHVATISQENLLSDTAECDAIITKLTGVKPTLYRAPYGEYSDAMLGALESNYTVIQWDVDVCVI